MAAGTLAGLGMLELHCANLEAPEVMVWNTAVVIVSGLVGGMIGWVARLREAGRVARLAQDRSSTQDPSATPGHGAPFKRRRQVRCAC
jgi:hypothetical protein